MLIPYGACEMWWFWFLFTCWSVCSSAWHLSRANSGCLTTESSWGIQCQAIIVLPPGREWWVTLHQCESTES